MKLVDLRGPRVPRINPDKHRPIRANPDLERAHVYLGRSLVFVADPADYPEAESVLLRGLKLDPSPALLPMAHSTLAELYRRSGRIADAERHQALADAAQRVLGR